MRSWKRMLAAALVLTMCCAASPVHAATTNYGGSAGEPVSTGSGSADVTDGAADSTTYVDPPAGYVSGDAAGRELIGAAFVNNDVFEQGFELPVKGATGWGVTDLMIRAKDDVKSKKVGTVKAGEAFEILEDGESYVRAAFANGKSGWVSKTYTMINLPDVLPSVVYRNSNSEASVFRSKGLELPGVTGEKMYEAKRENARFGEVRYDMPVLFNMAVKIAAAQRNALVGGDTLVIYETYRPMKTQVLVRDALTKVMNENKAVRDDINGWGKSWFIATGISNHQRGYAIDVSLAKIQDVRALAYGHYTMNVPGTVEEYEMPTAVHELSTAAATLVKPVTSLSATGWKDVELAATMTDGAKKLQGYLTESGLTPLASEWWHFNDLDARRASNGAGKGGFELSANVSKAYDTVAGVAFAPDFAYIDAR